MEEIEDDFTVDLDQAIRKVQILLRTDSLAVFSNIKVKRINHDHGKLISDNIYHINSIGSIRQCVVDVSIKEQYSNDYLFDSTNFLMRKEDLDRIINYLTLKNSNLILDNVW